MNSDINYSNGAVPIMPKAKSKKTTKNVKPSKKVDTLLKKQILLEQQVEFYKKHSNAKTLIIIFILLVLVLMWLYISQFGNSWLSETKMFFLSKGIVQAGF